MTSYDRASFLVSLIQPNVEKADIQMLIILLMRENNYTAQDMCLVIDDVLTVEQIKELWNRLLDEWNK